MVYYAELIIEMIVLGNLGSSNQLNAVRSYWRMLGFGIPWWLYSYELFLLQLRCWRFYCSYVASVKGSALSGMMIVGLLGLCKCLAGCLIIKSWSI